MTTCIVGVLVCCSLSGTAMAQCEGEWRHGVDQPVADECVKAMCVLQDGTVLAGGKFTQIAGVPARSIARLDPVTGLWSSVGAGVAGYVDTIIALPDGSVVVGGLFDLAGTHVAHSIARLNPVTGEWSAMGSGSNNGVGGRVSSLAISPSGSLLVGGAFGVSGLSEYFLATNTWSPIRLPPEFQGANRFVDAIAVAGESVYVTTDTNRVLRRMTAEGEWTSVGPAANGRIYAMLGLANGDLLVGGSFTQIGTTHALRFARYSASDQAWVPIGAGLNDSVMTLRELSSGEVLVGGFFSHANSINTGSIALFDPLNGDWSPLAGGTHHCAFSLAELPNGDVLAAGWMVQSQLSHRNWGWVATWNPASLCRGDVNCDDAVEIDDLILFLNAFAEGDAIADLGSAGGADVPDGVVTLDDLLLFLGLFEIGC